MATSPVARVALRAPSYQVNPYRGTTIPTRAELHLMNRLGVGSACHVPAAARRRRGWPGSRCGRERSRSDKAKAQTGSPT
jgi:hypothetical protein